jgi:hypothetical protein
MPRINIYEHSETYSFQVRSNNYATVALPIAAIWGPTFLEGDEDANPDWVHFPAGYRGTTDFVQTFRGANTYLGSREKSYEYCLKLLAAGYDILVKRVDGLGDKARYEAFIMPTGSTVEAVAAHSVMTLQPDDISSPIPPEKTPYHFLDPIIGEDSSKITWVEDGITGNLSLAASGVVWDAEKQQYVKGSRNQFLIEATAANKDQYIVAFQKPIVTTSTMTTDTKISIGRLSTIGKQVEAQGTMDVIVYNKTTKEALEKRKISLKEVYCSFGASTVTGASRKATTVSWTIPDFNYIKIKSLPLLLQLKQSTSANNFWSSNSEDAALGYITLRVGDDATDGSSTTLTATNYILGGGVMSVRIPTNADTLKVTAKYPGSFGNNLKIRIRCSLNAKGYKIGTVEVFDNNGHTQHPNDIVPTDQLLEIVSVAFDAEAATDNQPLITEATFANIETPMFYATLNSVSVEPSEYPVGMTVFSLYAGTDYALSCVTGAHEGQTPTATDVVAIVSERFDNSGSSYINYIDKIAKAYAATDTDSLIRLYNQQMLYHNFEQCLPELTDPLNYDWDAVFCGIADDQYIPKSFLAANPAFPMDFEVTSIMTKMVEVAASSKCGVAIIGTPFGMPRGIQTGVGSNAVRTGALKFKDDLSSAVGTVYSTFGEVVGPWCRTTLALSGSNAWICPELAHLLLIINSAGTGGINKWWMVPAGMLGTGVVHSPEYKIKKAYLDLIQDHDEGVCLNPLMEVPGKGFTCFGNSTLWDKPLGTYNALQNLSTRLLTNRVKQRIWDTALQILFKYNNEDAYSHFYAGLSPLLDEMRSVGALTGNDYNPWGYRIIMNPDIINLDRINANTVIGKVELAVTGVIDTVDVDLFLLPPTGFQETYD